MRVSFRRAAALVAGLLSCVAVAATDARASTPRKSGLPKAREICALIESAALRHGLPPDYLARLIWKESRFDAKALSPKGAQGVAQFMPDTARLRGLSDPWDPEQAIPASAAYLADLRRRFGNLGLAAAAYNSGEKRVESWLAGQGGLPAETRDYVQSITTRPADWFREAGREVAPRPLAANRRFAEACADLPVMRTRALATAAVSAPWGVQVAAGLTRPAAERAFRRLSGRLGALAAQHPPVYVKNRHRVRGAWSVRLAAQSRDAARRLCAKLRAEEGYCIVMRN